MAQSQITFSKLYLKKIEQQMFFKGNVIGAIQTQTKKIMTFVCNDGKTMKRSP